MMLWNRKRMFVAGAMLMALMLMSDAVSAQQTPALPWKVVTAPVKTSRVWTQALSQRDDGSMDYILQCWNYKKSGGDAKDLPEWLVVDLATGDTKRFHLPGYSNSNYTIDNPLRAPNGRIFFSCNNMNLNVYEPTTRQVKAVTHFAAEQDGYSILFNCIIGADGNFYAATQSNNGRVGVVTADSQTLVTRFYPDLTRKARSENLTYGYYTAVDPPWVYVCVGKGEWTLAAVNTVTDERRVLAENATWLSFDENPAATVVSVQRTLPANDGKTKAPELESNTYISGDKLISKFWCLDGKLVPFVAGAPSPIAAGKGRNERFANIKPLPNPVLKLELKSPDSEGQFAVVWSKPGQITPTTTRFRSEMLEPIELESLTYLPTDGSFLGNARQYQGFFRYYPDATDPKHQLENFGPHGPSGPIFAWMEKKLYFSGYPNGRTYCYDPAKPWNAGSSASTMPGGESDNPRSLLNLGGELSGAHHAYFLIPAKNGRIYFGGHRERGMTGTGLAWFEPSTMHKGAQQNGLSQLLPRGLVVNETLGSIIFSGRLEDDPYFKGEKATQADLVVFDMDLNERRRIVVKPGLQNTGWLYAGDSAGIVIGCINDDKKSGISALYRMDIQNDRLLQWVDLPKTDFVTVIFRNPANGSWWALVNDNRLCKFDPETLKLSTIGTLPGPLANALWRGESIWGTSGPNVVRIDGPFTAGK